MMSLLPAGPLPQLTPELIECLKFDLASGIQEPDAIAQRYGFEDQNQLRDYLIANPWLHHDAKHLRALLNADQNIGKRVMLKSLYAVEETIPALTWIVKNPHAHPKDRIDAYKELRQSGGVGAAGKEGVGAQGTSFNLIINMPGGQEKITTIVSPPPTEDE